MGKLGDRIVILARYKGVTLKLLAKQVDINYKTFIGKLKRDAISAFDLMDLSVALDLNLEEFKHSLGYGVNGKLCNPSYAGYKRMPKDVKLIEKERITQEILDLDQATYPEGQIVVELLKEYPKIKLLDILLDEDKFHIIGLFPDNPKIIIMSNRLQEEACEGVSSVGTIELMDTETLNNEEHETNDLPRNNNLCDEDALLKKAVIKIIYRK